MPATGKALLAPERISQIVGHTLEHFDQKTQRSQHYRLGEKRVRGFNALFATASFDAARVYFNHFQLLQEQLPSDRRLKVGLISSYGANDAVEDGALEWKRPTRYYVGSLRCEKAHPCENRQWMSILR